MKDPFLLYILLSVLVGFLLPTSRAATDILDWATKIAIFLLFLGYGVRLSTVEAWAGLKHWWPYLTIFVCTFVVFPVISLGLLHLPWYSPGLALGLAFLMLAPSTVQLSITFMSIAGGNAAGAIVPAATSSLLGVILTPLLVMALLSITGVAPIGWGSFDAVMVQLPLPFILKQFSHPWTANFMIRNRKNLGWLDQGVICPVVYGVFRDLRRNGITATGTKPLIMPALCLAILAFTLCFTRQLVQTLGFGRSDEIAIIFRGTKKSLATRVPMAMVLFADQAVGLVVLPPIVSHTLQLIACIIIAQRCATTDSVMNRSQDNNF